MWEDILRTYDEYEKIGIVAPIAHTRIIAHIGILLDMNANILAAAKIHQSIFAPCTEKSERRTSNIAPHLLYDNISYVSDAIDKEKHEKYMLQLQDFVKNSKSEKARIVYKYLSKNKIEEDLSNLVNINKLKNISKVVVFGVVGLPESTIEPEWIQYYTSKLPKNGICAITGKPDYIPEGYPKGIRYAGDMASIFTNKTDKLNANPVVTVGYIAGQKITHTLEALCGDWQEQGKLREVVVAYGEEDIPRKVQQSEIYTMYSAVRNI